MTPEEQQLITRTFDRMSVASPMAKDMDAERLIQQQIDRLPDAPYRLVQSVLLQQQALECLTDRLHQLEDAVARGVSADRLGDRESSFLSGYRAPPAMPTGSVPTVAATSNEPARQVGDRAAEPAPSHGGGFLASALTTASGVAGGMLLTDGLRELFGGRSSGLAERGTNRVDDLSALDRSQDEAQDARLDADEARRQLAEDDAALDEAQDQLDASGSDAGWDFGEA